MAEWVTFVTDREQAVDVRADAVVAVEDREPSGASLLVGGRWIWVKDEPEAVLERLEQCGG